MHKSLSSLIKFFFLFGFSTAVGLFKVFLISATVPPSDFGLYLGVILAASLMSYGSSFGIFDAFLVVPRNGSKPMELRTQIESTLMFSSLLSLILLLIGLAFVAYNDDLISLGDLTIPVVVFIFLQIRVNGMMCIVQGDNRPILYAIIICFKNLLPVICIGALSLISLRSIIFTEIISCIIIIILLHIKLKLNLISLLNYRAVFKFIKLGIWFTTNSFLTNIYNNCDKYLVGYLFGSLMLGLYGFMAQIVTVSIVVNMIVSVFFLPKLVTIFSKNPDRKKIFKYVSLLTLSTLVIGTIVFSILIEVLPIFVAKYLPQYIMALDYLQIVALIGILVMTNQYELYFRVRSLGGIFFGIQLITILISLFAFVVLEYIDSDLQTFLYVLASIRAINLISCVIFVITDCNSDPILEPRKFSNG